MHDTQNNTLKQVEYLDGFQYAGGMLSSAPAGSFAKIFLKDFLTLRPPTAEGYVAATQSGELLNPYIYNYVYNYTDHLGNIRLSYTKDPVSGDLEIMEENHYYPFGLKHSVYADPKQMYKLDDEEERLARPTYVYETEYQYKYNGKEFQDELGLNMYDYGVRNYDPALGRWMNVDPLADRRPDWTPYRYAFNNPNFFTDPTGMYEDIIDVNVNTGDVTVTEATGDDQVRLVNDDGSVVKDANGKDQSYTYGENGSFNKDNTITRTPSGRTTVVSKNPQKAFNFFKFAARSNVEFGFVRWTHNSGLQRATVITNHNPDNVNGLVPYMRTILGNGSAQRISEYWHSHPAPHVGMTNNHPSGFDQSGTISDDYGDRTAFKYLKKYEGRVPTNANIYSARFNTRTTYNDKSFTVTPNYTGGSLMLNADFGQ